MSLTPPSLWQDPDLRLTASGLLLVVGAFIAVHSSVVGQTRGTVDQARDPMAKLDHLLDTPSVESYSVIWKRAPFTLVTPATGLPEDNTSWTKNYILVRWSNSGSEEKVILADRVTQARVVVTRKPNAQGMVLLGFEVNAERSLSSAKLEKGGVVGTLRFETPVAAPEKSSASPVAGAAPNPNSSVPSKTGTEASGGAKATASGPGPLSIRIPATRPPRFQIRPPTPDPTPPASDQLPNSP